MQESENLIFFKIAGISMRPFFNTGDIFIAKKTPAKNLRVGDIVSYKSSIYEKGICHRLVKKVKRKNEYILYMRGDSCCILDEPVNEKLLWGRATAVIKNNRIISLIGPRQRIISKIIVAIAPFVSRIARVVRGGNGVRP